MARTNVTVEEREEMLARTEDFMLRGFDRAATIARNLSTSERQIDPRTAQKWIDVVRKRWQNRASQSQRDSLRFELIEAAREVVRRSWMMYSAAVNAADAKGRPANTFNAQAAALRNVLTAQERMAKLQGLDLDKVEHSISEATLEALRKNAIEESLGELGEDPLRTLRGAVSSDSGQGGADSAPTVEPAPASNAGDQA